MVKLKVSLNPTRKNKGTNIMRRIISLLIVVTFIGCNAYKHYFQYALVNKSFTITSIEKTANYYICQTVTKDDKNGVILVIDKKSKQLKDRRIEVGGIYSFQTYSFYDTVVSGGNFCHKVENKEVWCSTDGVDLRFTDSMGNEVYK